MKRFKSNIKILIFIIFLYLSVVEGCQNDNDMNNNDINNIIKNNKLVNLSESIFEITTYKKSNYTNDINADEIYINNINNNLSKIDLSFLEGYKIINSYYLNGCNFIILENLSLNKFIILQSNGKEYKVIFNGEGRIKKDADKPVIIIDNNIVISLENKIIYLKDNDDIKYLEFKTQIDQYAVSNVEDTISIMIDNQIYVINKNEIIKVNHPEDINIENLKWINETVVGKCLMIIYSKNGKKHLLISNIKGNIIYESKEDILDVGIGINYIIYDYKDKDKISINKYILSTNTEKKILSNKDIKSTLYSEDYLAVEYISSKEERFIRFYNLNSGDYIKYITLKLEQALEIYDDCYYNTNNNLITWIYHEGNKLFFYKTNYDYTKVNTYVSSEELFTIFTIEGGEVFGSKEFINEDGSENFYYKDVNSNIVIELGSLWGEGRGIRSLPFVQKVHSNYVMFNHKEIKNCYTGKEINFGIDVNEGNFNILYLDAYKEKLAILISYEDNDLLKYNLYEFSFITNDLILKDSFYFDTWQHPWYDFKVHYNNIGELYYDSYDEVKKIPVIKKINLEGKVETIINEGTYCLLFNDDKNMLYYHIKDIGLNEYNLIQNKKVNVDLKNKKQLNILEGTIYETENYVLELNYPNLNLYKKGDNLKKINELELKFNNDFREGGNASNIIIDIKEQNREIILSVIHKEWLGKEYKVEKYNINW